MVPCLSGRQFRFLMEACNLIFVCNLIGKVVCNVYTSNHHITCLILDSMQDWHISSMCFEMLLVLQHVQGKWEKFTKTHQWPFLTTTYHLIIYCYFVKVIAIYVLAFGLYIWFLWISMHFQAPHFILTMHFSAFWKNWGS